MTELGQTEVPIPGRLEIHRSTDEHGPVVALAGDLDLGSAPRLERELQQIEGIQPGGRVLIDLRGLSFMDSTGLSLIIKAQQAAERNGQRLALRRGPHQVQRLFELTGVLDVLAFED